MKIYILFLLSGMAVPTLVFSQDATEIPDPAQSEAEIQVRGEETSAEAKIRRLQQKDVDPVGKTAGELQQNPAAMEARRTAIAEKRAAMNNDTANPDAEPLKAEPAAADTIDTSDLANPESLPLQDTVKRANPDAVPLEDDRASMPTVDTAQGLANPEATPADVDADTTPVTDIMPENANPDAVANTANIEAVPRTAETDGSETETTTKAEEAAAAAEARMPERSAISPQPDAILEGAENSAEIQSRQNRRAPSERANRVLQETRRDRSQDAEVAARIEDDDDAESLIYSILGGAVAGGVAARVATSDDRARAGADVYRRGQRLPVAEVGRTQADRDASVDYLVRRFNGNASMQEAPYYRDQRRVRFRQPIFFDDNRRIVRYATRSEIPPVLVASNRLNRVDLAPAGQIDYRAAAMQANRYYNEAPEAYTDPKAYAISYRVDPDSAVSRDDILFQQGSTALADAYSYDLILDLAEAMKSSLLGNNTFVVEGHASAEGSYGANLALSQERAERIARDLVAYGVDPNRLIPVGYGEAEANHPADAPESLRALDRRVMVFRME